LGDVGACWGCKLTHEELLAKHVPALIGKDFVKKIWAKNLSGDGVLSASLRDWV
jgi:hypothetical protein